MICAHSTCKGWANHLSYPLSPSHWSGPALTSFKAPAYPPSENKQGHLFHVFPPLWYNVSPNKALPEFLVWPSINLYWLRRQRVLVGNMATTSTMLNKDFSLWSRSLSFLFLCQYPEIINPRFSITSDSISFFPTSLSHRRFCFRINAIQMTDKSPSEVQLSCLM